jgi:hypothetical protein
MVSAHHSTDPVTTAGSDGVPGITVTASSPAAAALSDRTAIRTRRPRRIRPGSIATARHTAPAPETGTKPGSAGGVSAARSASASERLHAVRSRA